MKTVIITILAALLLTSCMSEREYQLRKADIANATSWQATYCPVVIKGPLTIPAGGEMVVRVPSQPFQHANIPDGQAIQAKLASDILHTGAITAGAIYSIHKANKGGGDTTTTTTNNYNGGAQ